MKRSRIRPRTVAALIFAVAVAAAGMAPGAAAGRRASAVRAKECYYGSGIYSLGACRDGQRCVRGVNDEDYWEDDNDCNQTSSGGGGFRQI